MSRSETKNRIDHLLLDTDFFEKPENVEAVDRFGDLAPAAIMRLCLKLINEQGAQMKKSQVLSMWRASGTDQKIWAEILAYYVECGWLVDQNDYISSARIGKERTRVLQKRETLSANAKQKQTKSSVNEKQNTSKSPDTDTDTDLELKNNGNTDSTGTPGESTKPTHTKPDVPLSQYVFPGEFKLLRFDQIAWEALQMQLKPDELKRTIELAESYIAKHEHADPARYSQLKKQALAGKAYILSWAKSQASTQLASEKAAQNREKKSEGVKPPDVPRVQPKEFIPPKREQHTPDQIAANKAKLRELTSKTLGRLSA